MEMKKLLEAVDKFSFAGGNDQKQGPSGQLRGSESLPKKGSKKHPAYHKLVGGCEESILKDLDQVSEEKTIEWKLAEEFSNFNEDDLGVEPKRKARDGSRHERGHEPQPRYKTVKQEGSEYGKPQLKGMFFYNIRPQDEDLAIQSGLKKTKNGKWALPVYNTSGGKTNRLKAEADSSFGKGHWWEKPTEECALNEAPIEMNPEDPMDPMIYGHKQFNPGSLKFRMSRASRQLADLANTAQTATPAEWQRIARRFEELAMNIELIRHGLEELAKVRRGGGTRSRGIDKDIDESMPSNTPATTATTPVNGATPAPTPAEQEQAKKVAAATAAIKSATSAPAAPAQLAQTLNKASTGQALSTQDMKTLAPVMGVVGKTAQDPKLAAQFKTLATQAKTVK